MKFVPALLASLSASAVVAILSAAPARADNRVFIIASQSDGYGIDECLAKGETCGAPAARSYCQAREFTEATAFRRVDPDEITGSVPQSAAGQCLGGGCAQFIAITCQR